MDLHAGSWCEEVTAELSSSELVSVVEHVQVIPGLSHMTWSLVGPGRMSVWMTE